MLKYVAFQNNTMDSHKIEEKQIRGWVSKQHLTIILIFTCLPDSPMQDKIKLLNSYKVKILFFIINYMLCGMTIPGSQKDKYHGNSGTQEDWNSIRRFLRINTQSFTFMFKPFLRHF